MAAHLLDLVFSLLSTPYNTNPDQGANQSSVNSFLDILRNHHSQHGTLAVARTREQIARVRTRLRKKWIARSQSRCRPIMEIVMIYTSQEKVAFKTIHERHNTAKCI